MTGQDAVELLLAGADAVQVGTATFRDPRAPWKVLRQLGRWCEAHRTTVAAIRAGVGRRVVAEGGASAERTTGGVTTAAAGRPSTTGDEGRGRG
jgi:hypothetical protein